MIENIPDKKFVFDAVEGLEVLKIPIIKKLKMPSCKIKFNIINCPQLPQIFR